MGSRRTQRSGLPHAPPSVSQRGGSTTQPSSRKRSPNEAPPRTALACPETLATGPQDVSGPHWTSMEAGAPERTNFELPPRYAGRLECLPRMECAHPSAIELYRCLRGHFRPTLLIGTVAESQCICPSSRTLQVSPNTNRKRARAYAGALDGPARTSADRKGPGSRPAYQAADCLSRRASDTRSRGRARFSLRVPSFRRQHRQLCAVPRARLAHRRRPTSLPGTPRFQPDFLDGPPLETAGLRAL